MVEQNYVNGTLFGGYIYTSSDSGATWTQTEPAGYFADDPDTQEHWQSVASSADGGKLVAVSDEWSNVFYSNIYASSDSGATWTKTGAPAGYWSSVASSSDGTKLVAVVSYGCIYTSTGPLP